MLSVSPYGCIWTLANQKEDVPPEVSEENWLSVREYLTREADRSAKTWVNSLKFLNSIYTKGIDGEDYRKMMVASFQHLFPPLE